MTIEKTNAVPFPKVFVEILGKPERLVDEVRDDTQKKQNMVVSCAKRVWDVFCKIGIVIATILPGLNTVVFLPVSAYCLLCAYRSKNKIMCDDFRAAALAYFIYSVPVIGNICAVWNLVNFTALKLGI